MDIEIIRRWNRNVHKEDYVYVLGDFAYKNRTRILDFISEQLDFYEDATIATEA